MASYLKSFDMYGFIKNDYNKIKFKRGTSLLEAIPEIVDYWDYDKNKLGPDEYTFADKRKAWFVCENGHSFERDIVGMRGSSSRAGSWCKYCGGTSRLDNNYIDEFLDKSENLNLQRLTNYINNDNYIDFLCLDCENIWTTSWQSIRSGSECPMCAGVKKYTQKEIDEILIKENRGIKRIGNYRKAKESIVWSCNRCGHSWKNSWWNINSENRNQGCSFCDNPNRIDNDIIDALLDTNNKKIERISNYIDSKSDMKWKCLDCNKVWTTKWRNIQSGTGCTYCQPTSKGEIEIENFLNSYDIQYKKEVWFDDLKHIRHLRFDFGLYGENKELKCLIEYDGIQHFRKWNRITEKQFEDLKMRDKMKDEYCQKKDIYLVRIPYTDFENIDIILSEIVEEIYDK